MNGMVAYQSTNGLTRSYNTAPAFTILAWELNAKQAFIIHRRTHIIYCSERAITSALYLIINRQVTTSNTIIL